MQSSISIPPYDRLSQAAIVESPRWSRTDIVVYSVVSTQPPKISNHLIQRLRIYLDSISTSGKTLKSPHSHPHHYKIVLSRLSVASVLSLSLSYSLLFSLCLSKGFPLYPSKLSGRSNHVGRGASLWIQGWRRSFEDLPSASRHHP